MLSEWTIGSMLECYSPSSLPGRLLHTPQGSAHMPPPPGSLPDCSVQGHILLFVLGFRLVFTFRAQAMAADTPGLPARPSLHDSGPGTPLLLVSSPVFSGDNDSTSIMGSMGKAHGTPRGEGLGRRRRGAGGRQTAATFIQMVAIFSDGKAKVSRAGMRLIRPDRLQISPEHLLCSHLVPGRQKGTRPLPRGAAFLGAGETCGTIYANKDRKYQEGCEEATKGQSKGRGVTCVWKSIPGEGTDRANPGRGEGAWCV